ncbi:MAG: dimethylamine/trimethylamine dehydrogenase [Urechidicola sp.]|jgi:dimethylamine/trimethylamine dehydrogenase
MKMVEKNRSVSEKYLQTLLTYYEEEVSGESYFYCLAEHFSEKEKTILLARIERVAAKAVEPLLKKYNLVSRDEKVLHQEGLSHVDQHQSYSWNQFMTYIVERYPGYLDEFEDLEAMAPKEDLPALKRLTEHEIIVIDFAHKELAGNQDSIDPLMDYLS